MIIKKAETEQEKQDAYYVRNQVFVIEQQIPSEIEIDEHEDTSVHFVAYKHNKPVGAARVRIIDDYAKVERVCVLKDFRHDGIGNLIMNKIEQFIKEQYGLPIMLNAQLEVVPFYKQRGYTVSSIIFYEANIPHVAMKK